MHANFIVRPRGTLVMRVRILNVTFLVLLITGCGRRSELSVGDAPLKQDMLRALEDCGILQIPVSSPPPRLEITALVDLSLSMRPFAGPQPVAPHTTIGPEIQKSYRESNFLSALRALANQPEVRVWSGWGTTLKGDIKAPLAGSPADPKLYSLSNNDYAALISTLPRPRSGKAGVAAVHLIISDGVQSQRDAFRGGTLGPTARAIQKWIQEGGAAELRLLDAPYYGTYYSERDRRRITEPGGESSAPRRYNEPKRPFLLLALLESPEALPAWGDFWTSRSGLKELKPLAAPISIPSATSEMLYKVQPADTVPLPDRRQLGIRGSKVWELTTIDLEGAWRSIYTAKVKKVFSSAKGMPLPVYFEVLAPVTKGTEAELLQRLKRTLHPKLAAFQRVDMAAANVGKSGSAKEAAPRDGFRWQAVKDSELENQDPNFLLSPTAPAGKSPSPLATVRYLIPERIPRPIVLNFIINPSETPSAQASPPSRYDAWSTNDDSTARDSGKIYQLNTLVEQIVTSSPAPQVTSCSSALYVY
jgi:hypothetical protein